MKKIIILALIAFMFLGSNKVNALSIAYHEPLNDTEQYGRYVCPKVLELLNQLGEKTTRYTPEKGEKIITYFPFKSATFPMNCDSPQAREDGTSITPCVWKVGDYTDEGILLYQMNTMFVGGTFQEYPTGETIFVYTDNTDYVTDECFYDEYIYEKTKNFKYTSTSGRNIVVKAFKKTNYKYKDYTYH